MMARSHFRSGGSHLPNYAALRKMGAKHRLRCVLMHAHNRCRYFDGSIMSSSQCIHDPAPHAGPTPANESAHTDGGRRLDCTVRYEKEYASARYGAVKTRRTAPVLEALMIVTANFIFGSMIVWPSLSGAGSGT